jgi:nitrogen fixation protein FixH
MQTPNPTNTLLAAVPKARAATFRWPLIIIAMLATHVTIMMIAVTLATRDPDFSVVPDYYNKATHWDQQQAALKASALLGWHLRIEPAPQVDPLGVRNVRFTLVDAAGVPIHDAAIEVAYFHHAHGDHTQTLQLHSDATGTIEQPLPMRYEGIWEFHCTATANGHSFTQSSTQWITNSKNPA